MNKKSSIIFSLLSTVVMSSALAGCGPGVSHKTAHSTSPVTITFWNEMTGPYKVALAGEIHQFEKSHPQITVNDIVVPNDAALEPKLLTAIVAGNPPTLSQMNPPWATGFIQTHSLINLNPLIKGPHGFSLTPFYPNLLKPGKWPNGDQYLLPFNLGAAIMYYNKNAFDNAGITAPPKTWTQFARDAAKLSGSGKQAFAITLVHTYPWLAFFDQAAGNFVGSNGMPNKAAFSSHGPAVKALTLWSNMVKNGSAVLTHGYASQTDFANETSSILIGTTGFYPYVQAAVGNKFTLAEAPLPHDVRHATSMFGGYLGIFAKSTPSQQRAAFSFVKYLTSKTGQLYWMEHSQGYLPVRTDVAQAATAFLKTHPAQRVSLSVLPTAVAEPKVAWWDQFSHEVLLNAIVAVLINKETPVQAMHAAYQQAVKLARKDGTYQ
ncbi:MAG: hypothetical protein C7B43_04840 [Sulfobacillus benefaciens]|uniref:ABC transporter substrate-binding protein n=1 Tax=Sulfobacillus benefaciens TaxID=453960 RepID=A0A2T2X8M0_9FIRM|nr:MAG: hypothetical protein C7B43_04840 [Sulfobacillus benefaciens]